MAKKLKRAFTIVELVIVIAVIAILAAVLIPTFTTLIDKANQSADTSNVKNMNTILSMDETTNGKPKTMHDAVKVIREGGYDLEKLTPTGQGYDIVWDQDANRLLMVNGDEVIFGETEKNANEKHLWVVVDSAEKIAATGYSVYLTDVFEGTVTAEQGVDVGSNEDITKVTYNTAEEQNVTIRTNGGALEVDAGLATVSHYDTAASVDIKKVADESYHEYGTVNQINVTAGRVVLESGAATKTVYVKGEGVKVEWKEDSKPVEVGISTMVDDTKVQLPTDSDVPVKEVDEEVSSLFAGGLGTAGSPYQIATAEQFENINDLFGNSAIIYYQLINDNIDLAETETHIGQWEHEATIGNLKNAIIDGNNYKLIAKEGVAIFGDCQGTIVFENLQAEIKNCPMVAAAYRGADMTFENVTVSGDYYANDGGNIGIFLVYGWGDLTFKNCLNLANLSTTSYNAIFVGYSFGGDWVFENCTNSGKLVCDKAAMFVGNDSQVNSGANPKLTLNITNCKNTGEIRSTDVRNYGWNCYVAVAKHPEKVNIFINGVQKSFDDVLDNGFVQGPNDTSLSIVKNEDGTFTITKSSYDNTAYYKISIGLYTQLLPSGTNRFYVNEVINAEELVSGSYISKIKELKFVSKYDELGNEVEGLGEIQQDICGNDIVTIDGIEYFLMNQEGEYLKGISAAQMITVYAYDENDNLISSANLVK